MKKISLLFVLFVLSFSYSQEIKEEANVYDVSEVDTRPEFKGGMTEFYTFVDKNFKFNNKENLKGKIYTQFIVEIDGTLSNFKIIKDMGYGTGEEALKLLKKSPKWNVGIKNGKPVRTKFLLPIIINDWRWDL